MRRSSRASQRPVLVTGMHRSGTSWLAGMLCAGGDFINVGEPLNCLNRQTILRAPVRRWYTYICEQNEHPYLGFYEDALRFRPHPILDIKRMRFGSPRDPVRITRRWGDCLLGRLQARATLFKDPFAVFSLDWFARRLDCEVVVIVRTPAAVVSSLKRMGWTFDFYNLLEQPLLINHHRLERFRPEMEVALACPADIIGQASTLWKIIYRTVNEYHSLGAPFHIVRHEDLASNPLDEYARLYETLGLRFTASTRHRIERFTSDRNPAEASPANPFDTRLASRANLASWRRRLNSDEIKRVERLTEEVAAQYYPDPA
jgi:hypothetical protein